MFSSAHSLESKYGDLSDNSGAPESIVLTVYFSGSNHRIIRKKDNIGWETKGWEPLAGLLFKYNSKKQLARGFDGCGEVAGDFLGGLFGVGLHGQVRQAVDQVRQLHKTRKKIVVNCYGHSRGAIAALLLAKKLNEFNRSQVEVNLALSDPVPGNLPFTTKIDFLDFTLANQVMDLSDCQNLCSVLCLYPYEPLQYFAAHAPLIPVYPKYCIVEEDVILGTHSEAQFQGEGEFTINFTPTSFIHFARIINFLKECGSAYNFEDLAYLTIVADSNINFHQSTISLAGDYTEILKDIYNRAQTAFTDVQRRECHSAQQLEIVANKTKTSYLNIHHAQLAPEIKGEGYTLSIQPKNGIIAYIRRSPRLYNAIKWFLLGLAAAITFYSMGGLEIIPYLSDWGAFALLPLTPVFSFLSGIALKGIIKPLLNFSAGLFDCCYNDKGYFDSLDIKPSHERSSSSLILRQTSDGQVVHSVTPTPTSTPIPTPSHTGDVISAPYPPDEPIGLSLSL